MANALARQLSQSDCTLIRWARDSARLPSGGCASWREIADADVAVLCVSDNAIHSLAEQLVGEGCLPSAVLHTSGFHGAEALQALADAGCSVGGLHPLVSVPAAAGQSAAEHLCGSSISVFGQDSALQHAQKIVQLLGAHVLHIQSDQRPLYHACAALAASGTVALFELVLQNSATTQVPGSEQLDLRKGLVHLCQGVLNNLGEHGTAAALTGPVPRGDGEVLAAHLARLNPAARAAYRMLLEPLLHLAQQQGTPAEKLSAIESLIGESPAQDYSS